MDIKEKIARLVIAADRLMLGYSVDIPAGLQASKILLSTVQKYAPPFEDRLVFLSWEYAYRRWLSENPGASFQEFQSLCMVPETHYLYSVALAELSRKLPKEITLEYLEPVLKTSKN